MPNSKRIAIVVAVDWDSIENVYRLSESLRGYLHGYELDIQVLVYNAPTAPEKHRLSPSINVFAWVPGYTPIVLNRNRCQQHLKRTMRANGCFGMVLDDDLVWHMKEAELDCILDVLLADQSDMAFLGLDGDPPIPKEYSRACPILDALLHLRKAGELGQGISDRYFADIQLAVGEPPSFSHHDYYALKKEKFHARPFGLDLNDFVHKLYRGQATTRTQRSISAVTEATGRERGGATLILNPEILSVPNRSISLGDYVSRRSDMVMALSAFREGFRMHCTPPALSHVRSESFDSHDPAKLVSDVLGVALVESMIKKSDFKSEFEARARETITILTETNKMFSLFSKANGLKPDSLSSIDLMRYENQQTIECINHLVSYSSKDLPSMPPFS
ncbi:MAG: hypothetical protein ACQEV6_06765 [Pseudomonadota bacterium]